MQGGPQPIQGAAVAAGQAGGPSVVYAEPGPRFVAFLIDSGITFAAVILAILLGVLLAFLWEPLGLIVGITGYLAAFAFSLYNTLYLQGTTGQSIGKRHQGIKVVEIATGQPVGVLMTFVRQLVIGVFAMPCYLDHWYIFVDDRNQRLSDNVLKYHVLRA